MIVRGLRIIIYCSMERKVSPSLNDQKGNIKSSFISQYSPQSKERTSLNLTSRKQLSSSTFLDLEQSKGKFATNRKISRKESEYAPLAEQLTRARSLRNIEENKFKSIKLIENAPLNSLSSLNENTLKLKAEELLFKLKVKLGTLLQEVSVPEGEMTRFNKIGKVDELILFLSEKVRERIADLTASPTASSPLERTSEELEALRGKLLDKEASEKTYRAKLKESNAQLKALYDRVNTKEREYSQKITQIYQLKTQMKEIEKVVEAQRGKLAALEKERTELKGLLSSDSRGQGEAMRALQAEKAQLLVQLQQTKEQLEKYRQKEAKVQQLNFHLNEQLTRWRQRFQFQGEGREGSEKEKSSQGNPLTPNDIPPNQLKKSTMSMNSAYINNFNNSTRLQSLTSLQIENTKLRLQLKELQKENEQLQRNLLNYSSFKEKYQSTLDMVGEKEVDLSRGIDPKKLDYLKQRSADLYRSEIENHYRRKIEQVAREWKEKLYDIVCKYEDEAELLKAEIFNLTHAQQLAEKRIYALANEKYALETRIIQIEQASPSSSRRIPASLPLPDKGEEDKEEELSVHLELRPIAEEDSPLKSKKDSGQRVTLDYFRESFGTSEG